MQAVHDNGIRPLVKVRTGLGDEILCTPEHKFLVRGAEGETWREAGRLRADDYVMVDLGHTEYGTLQRLEAEEPTAVGEAALPALLDEAFAVWLGWAHGEGRLKPVAGSGALNVHLDGEDKTLVERYRAFTQSVFGREDGARTARGGDAPPATVCPPRVARFLQVNGLWRNGSQTIPASCGRPRRPCGRLPGRAVRVRRAHAARRPHPVGQAPQRGPRSPPVAPLDRYPVEGHPGRPACSGEEPRARRPRPTRPGQ